MATKQLKPITPASRFASRPDFTEITTSKPEKSLVRKLNKTGGRNNKGRITSRRRGGGHKRSYRIIDFKRNKFDISCNDESCEMSKALPLSKIHNALISFASLISSGPGATTIL